MTREDDLKFLKRCVEISHSSRKNGNTPFGALLVDGKGNIVMEQENIELGTHDATGHAETTLVRNASQKFPKDFMAECTLYTSAEPCAMCAGAIYWGNIRRVVYGMSERRLLELTGSHEQNPTFDLPCREVFAKGQRKVEVVGPFEEIEMEAAEAHKGFWD